MDRECVAERLVFLAKELVSANIKYVGFPKKFWVVTKPTKESELGDICFEADIGRLMLQFRGGLDVDEIVGVYGNESAAKKDAEKLLVARK